MTLRQRFESKIDRSGDCHLWKGSRTAAGYGRIGANTESLYAHRLSYALNIGPVGEFHVLHRCDNPSCVNPDHLFLGTNADNVKDMMMKGRDNAPKGVDCAKAKLTRKQVRVIRSSDKTHRALGVEYDISHNAIGRIKRGESYQQA